MPNLTADRQTLDSRTNRGDDLLNEIVRSQQKGDDERLCLLSIMPERLIAPTDRRPAPSVTSEGRDLEQLLQRQHNPSAAEQKSFHENVEAFLRCSLSVDEKRNTLRGLRDILDSKSTIFSAEERSKIAQQALRQAADPASVSQGDNRTCSVTSLENVLYRSHPSAVVQLLAKAVNTGKFITPDKTVIEPDKASLKADEEGLRNPTKDGERSHASQLFQVFAINSYWSRQNKGPDGTPVPAGKIQYRHNYSEGKETLDECLLDTSKTPPVVLKATDGTACRSPKLGVDELPDVYKQITGLTPTVLCVRYGEKSGLEKGIRTVSSLPELENFLATNKNQPLIFKVDSHLLTDKNVDARTESTTGHDVVIAGYDSRKRRVQVDNSWSNSSDHLDRPGHGKALSLESLMKSMNPPRGFRKE